MLDTLYRIINKLKKNKFGVVENNLLNQATQALVDDYVNDINLALAKMKACVDGQIYLSTPITNYYNPNVIGNSLSVIKTTGVCTVNLGNYTSSTLSVYKNGVRQFLTVDYLANNPSTGVFTFLNPPLYSTDYIIATYYPLVIVPSNIVPINP